MSFYRFYPAKFLNCQSSPNIAVFLSSPAVSFWRLGHPCNCESSLPTLQVDIYRVVVQVPVHLLTFQSSIKPLQQAQFSKTTILNENMIEVVARLVLELFRQEVDTVLGDRCLHTFEKTATSRRLAPLATLVVSYVDRERVKWQANR